MKQTSMDKNKTLKRLLNKAKILEKTIDGIINSKDTLETYRYSSFKSFLECYNDIVEEIVKNEVINGDFYIYNIENVGSAFDTLWPMQKQYAEDVLLKTRLLINTIDSDIDFVEDELKNIENFITSKLRATFSKEPLCEKEVQQNLEILFLGKNFKKGSDYEKESGKFNFSGREYIPDFVLKKLNLAIEIKLIKGTKTVSKIIEEINADIVAYKKAYENIMFVIYDFGKIQNEEQFRSDLENIDDIRIIIVKH